MYLLEAKKKAEKEEKARQKQAVRDNAKKVQQQAQQARMQQHQVRAPPPTNQGPSLADQQRSAAQKRDQQRALADQQRKDREAAARRKQMEESQMQEAIRRSKMDQERSRQRDINATRQVLQEEGPSVVLQSRQLRGNIKVQSFHEPDEFDAHWQDMKVPCLYVGTFAVDMGPLNKQNIERGMKAMMEYEEAARRANLVICREGIKVVDTSANKVAMAHSLSRISMASAGDEGELFGFVAKNPKVSDRFCHVFKMKQRKFAVDCQGLVKKAFGLAFAANKQTMKRTAAKGGGAGLKAAAKPPPQQKANQKKWAKHNPLQGTGAPVQPGRSSQEQAGRAARTSASSEPRSPPPQRAQKAPAPAVAKAPPPTKPSAPKADASGGDAPGGSNDLAGVAWYQPGIPREIAMELLNLSEEGSFIVRDSSSQPGHFALTMKASGLMHHYIIRKVPQGYCLGSEDQGQKPLGDLATLIIDYSRSKGCLPMCLNLDTFNKLDEESDDEDDDDGDASSFVDPDYQSLKELGINAGGINM